MAHAGRLTEEWELEVAEDNFEDADEDVQWVEGDRSYFPRDDTNKPRDGAAYDWSHQRGMMSPLEGAQREAEMDDKIFTKPDAVSTVNESRDGTDISRTDTNDLGSQPTGTGGDQFQAMDDGSGDGETYYYDEDMTRAGDFSDRASNVDLIFRTPQLIDQSRMKALLRYTIVAIVAFVVGTLFGVLLDLITSSCINDPMTATTTPEKTTSPTMLLLHS